MASNGGRKDGGDQKWPSNLDIGAAVDPKKPTKSYAARSRNIRKTRTYDGNQEVPETDRNPNPRDDPKDRPHSPIALVLHIARTKNKALERKKNRALNRTMLGGAPRKRSFTGGAQRGNHRFIQGYNEALRHNAQEVAYLEGECARLQAELDKKLEEAKTPKSPFEKATFLVDQGDRYFTAFLYGPRANVLQQIQSHQRPGLLDEGLLRLLQRNTKLQLLAKDGTFTDYSALRPRFFPLITEVLAASYCAALKYMCKQQHIPHTHVTEFKVRQTGRMRDRLCRDNMDAKAAKAEWVRAFNRSLRHVHEGKWEYALLDHESEAEMEAGSFFAFSQAANAATVGLRIGPSSTQAYARDPNGTLHHSEDPSLGSSRGQDWREIQRQLKRLLAPLFRKGKRRTTVIALNSIGDCVRDMTRSEWKGQAAFAARVDKSQPFKPEELLEHTTQFFAVRPERSAHLLRGLAAACVEVSRGSTLTNVLLERQECGGAPSPFEVSWPKYIVARQQIVSRTIKRMHSSSPTKRGRARTMLLDMPTSLRITHWNIATINNNPFEYWMDSAGAEYETNARTTASEKALNQLMLRAEMFITEQRKLSHAHAVKVGDVFTRQMFNELKRRMAMQRDPVTGAGWTGIKETETYFFKDLRNRSLVQGVLFDDALGKKRLCSWPDRFTNTIRYFDDKGQSQRMCRPSVINNSICAGFSNPDSRWKLWLDFMFKTKVRKSKGAEPQLVCQLLKPLKRSKYPALTAEEERISMPLQTVCLAMFDLIMFKVMDFAAPGTWISLKETVVQASADKNGRILQILQNSYGKSDIMFICEASATLLHDVGCSTIGEQFFMPTPDQVNVDKDQNSFVLLRKDVFGDHYETPRDITAKVVEAFGSAKVPLSPGDLLLLHLKHKNGRDSCVLGSFHGDTQGLATLPVLEHIMKVVDAEYPDSRFIFGLDANCYCPKKKGTLFVGELSEFLASHKLCSCFGSPIRGGEITTCMARTFLQPQMNKANTAATRMTGGDVNPKDHIIYRDGTKDSDLGHYLISPAERDNTGSRVFVQGITFPTLTFPSDHAVVHAELGFGVRV